ncbi:MAG: triple tyrosine motif-containing protein [Agriterribacter sp.]
MVLSAAKGTLGIPDNTIWCMLATADKRIWIGTQTEELLLADKEKGLVDRYKLPGSDNHITTSAVRSLCKMNDSILLVAQENGVIHFFNTHSFSFNTYNEGLSRKLNNKNFVLKCVFYSAPYICIGTLGNGMYMYHVAADTLIHLTEEQGLPNNTVYGILSDDLQNLWLSTNKGICSFKIDALLDNGKKSLFRKFTVADGLQGNEFNTGAYAKAADGTLLFGGINGINFFKPENFPEDPRLVKIAVTSIAVDNVQVPKDTMLVYKKLLDLSYQYRSIAFRFSVLDFASVNRYSYYYQMVGYDKQWVEAGSRNFTTYTNLPAGKYTFNIKAVIPGSQVETSITSIAIIVHPPFWKTWWFIVLFVTVVFFALYSLYRYRLRQLLQVQMVRNRIATDLHDDIGSALSNINMLAAITEKKLANPDEAKNYLHRISEEVNASSQSLDDIIWSIDTKNDTVEETVARMRRYAAELFEARDHIKYELDFDEDFSQQKLNIEQRRDIYLIYKEALNNIYKHADARNVWVSVQLKNGFLHLLIKDNGKGFDVNHTTHRNGLKNIRARVEKWKGKLSITSGVGGSELKAEIPF